MGQEVGIRYITRAYNQYPSRATKTSNTKNEKFKSIGKKTVEFSLLDVENERELAVTDSGEIEILMPAEMLQSLESNQDQDEQDEEEDEGGSQEKTKKNLKCTFWDKGQEAWSTQGCDQRIDSEGRFFCICTHLTEFSVAEFSTTIQNSNISRLGNVKKLEDLSVENAIGLYTSVILLTAFLLTLGYARAKDRECEMTLRYKILEHGLKDEETGGLKEIPVPDDDRETNRGSTMDSTRKFYKSGKQQNFDFTNPMSEKSDNDCEEQEQLEDVSPGKEYTPGRVRLAHLQAEELQLEDIQREPSMGGIPSEKSAKLYLKEKNTRRLPTMIRTALENQSHSKLSRSRTRASDETLVLEQERLRQSPYTDEQQDQTTKTRQWDAIPLFASLVKQVELTKKAEILKEKDSDSSSEEIDVANKSHGSDDSSSPTNTQNNTNKAKKPTKTSTHCKKIWQEHHPILSIVYVHSITYSRVARVIVFYSVLIGQLMLIGTFYQTNPDDKNSSGSKSNQKATFIDILVNLEMRDVYVAIISSLLMIPVALIMAALYKGKDIPVMAPFQEQLKVFKKNRRRIKLALGIAFIWWLFCMYAITIYAITFPNDDAYRWIISSLIGIVYDVSLGTAIKVAVLVLLHMLKVTSTAAKLISKVASLR